MLESLLENYGLLGIFLAGFLEEIIAIIPSSVVFLAAGALLVKSGWDIFWIAALGAAGVTLGSFVIYWLVWWGGEQLIVNYGKYFGIRWRDIERLRQWFTGSGLDEAVLVGARVIPVVSNTGISAFCGLIHLPWKEFVWTTFVGSVGRVALLTFLGWLAGEQYRQFSLQFEQMEKYLIAVVVLIIVALFIYGYYYYRRKRRPVV